MNNGMIIWSPGVTLDNVEEQVIRFAYLFYKKNKTATARALGIANRTLDERLERYDAADRQRIEKEAQAQSSRADWLDRARYGAKSNAIAPKAGAELPRAAAGVYVESTEKLPGESALSVSKPQEIQKVLSGQASGGGARKNR